jgi:lipopolysaccharide heptosyltransferase II
MQGLRPFDSSQDKPRPLVRRFILSGRSRRADLSRRSPASAGRRRTERNAAGADVPGDAAESRCGMQDRLVRERILCVKTHAIGDALMVTPALRVEIVVLTGGQCADVLGGNPAVDDVIVADESKLQRADRRELTDLLRGLRRGRFSRAYVFQRSHALHFLLFLARVPNRVGLSYSPWAPFLTRVVVWPSGSRAYAGDMYLRVVGGRGSEAAWPLSFPLSERDELAARDLLEREGVGGDEDIVALAPGGGRNPRDYVPHKRWEPRKFAQVADTLAAETGCRVVVVGAPDDLPCSLAVRQHANTQVVDLCGRTTLRTLAGVLRRSKLLITNDSAPLHIAVAVETPSVVLFGPSDPRALLPPGSMIHCAVQSSAPCSPCYANEPFPGCDDWICMDRISVADVLGTARRLLEGSRT